MVQGSNAALGAGSPAKVLSEFPKEFEELGVPGSLVRVAKNILGLSSTETRYLEAIPPALREAIRAAIYDAVNADKSVQISYFPAYDFEVRFADYGQALSIQVSGPYEAASPRGKARYEKPAKRRATRAARPRAKQAQRRRGARRGR
jgi:hypothetical protein